MAQDRFNEASNASAVERTAHVLPVATGVPAADDPYLVPTSSILDSSIKQVSHPIKEQKSRRPKIIAALQRIENTGIIADVREGNDSHETSRRGGVGYASDGALNSVLTDGVTYQLKRVGPSSKVSSVSSGMSPENHKEFLGPD